MNLDLSGKCAIVGGASQGIGYGIAHLLASEGARVAITARREKDLCAAAEKMTAETGAECQCRRIAARRRIANVWSNP
jgi:3-oxoacyl-[acyl-carrier protein] reductase